MNWQIARRVRQAAQIVFFALAVFLLLAALRGRAAFPLADIFFRFNPLSALASMISSRAWIPRLGLALGTVVLTLLVGRVWCGWICPLGSLLDWVHIPSARRREGRLAPGWRKVKLVLLALILAAAVLGNLTLLVLDPLALFTRGMTVVALPALDQAVTAVESAAYQAAFLRPVVDWLETGLRGPLLPVKPAVYAGNVLIAVLLAGILGLNVLADRFWCRNLCPLGALLGLLSRFAIFRPLVGTGCRSCARCARACRVGAIRQPQKTRKSLPETPVGESFEVIPSECVMCLDCLESCSQKELGLRAVLPPQPAPVEARAGTSMTRREALGVLAGAAAAVLVVETDPRSSQRDAYWVRPPGAQQEDLFLSHCLRCAECIRICPTAGLQPALTEAGLQALGTPHLVPRLGACDYGCNACGQVCPSGAIPRLGLEAKRETVIGLAAVNRSRCLPWAYDTPCIVCEEMCPRPTKAIRLEEVTVKDAGGQAVVLQRPVVLRDLCIGCGICEKQCPQEGEAAIRVYQRS